MVAMIVMVMVVMMVMVMVIMTITMALGSGSTSTSTSKSLFLHYQQSRFPILYHNLDGNLAKQTKIQAQCNAHVCKAIEDGCATTMKRSACNDQYISNVIDTINDKYTRAAGYSCTHTRSTKKWDGNLPMYRAIKVIHMVRTGLRTFPAGTQTCMNRV